MSKLKKGQNITKTAEETAVELNGKMSMDAELIGNFITQQVAVAMPEKTKQYEKKIKKLEKGGIDRVSGELSPKTVRGAVDAPPRKSKHPRLNQTQSQDHLRNLRIDRHKAERVSFGASQGDDPNKQALTTVVLQKKGKNKKVARSKSASALNLQTSKTDGAKLRARYKKTYGKATAYFQMNDGRQKIMRSSSLPLRESGFTFSDQLTLPSTILQLARSPKERYNRC